MTIFNDQYCVVAPTKDVGVCPESKRWYCILYVAIKKKEYFAYTSCSHFDLATKTPDNFAIEFLDETFNSVQVAYDCEMFEEIEKVACEMFTEMKQEELNVV